MASGSILTGSGKPAGRHGKALEAEVTRLSSILDRDLRAAVGVA